MNEEKNHYHCPLCGCILEQIKEIKFDTFDEKYYRIFFCNNCREVFDKNEIWPDIIRQLGIKNTT